MSTSVRLASKKDIPKLRQLACDSFYVTYGPFNPGHVLDDYVADNFSHEQLSHELKDVKNHFYVAEAKGQIVGYMKLAEDNLPDCAVEGKPLEISRIYADPELKGRGIGSSLIKIAEDEAKSMGYDALWLGVFQINEPAVSFYKKKGFSIAGVTIFMMGDDAQDDYIMMKGL